jgi:mannose/fructose/N-acetylgalactosamine-specific phosphotransferase system component IIC
MIGVIGTIRALLAHQGGWDEILMVAGPIAIIVGLLAVVRRRLGSGVAASDDHQGTESHVE